MNYPGPLLLRPNKRVTHIRDQKVALINNRNLRFRQPLSVFCLRETGERFVRVSSATCLHIRKHDASMIRVSDQLMKEINRSKVAFCNCCFIREPLTRSLGVFDSLFSPQSTQQQLANCTLFIPAAQFQSSLSIDLKWM